MSAPATLPWLLAGAALALLGAALWVLRRRTRRLERLLQDTSAKLEELQVTVLFADLQGFTAMCDRLDPAQTVDILNGYFRCMSEAIKRHHGRVTELVGDELLALFGALSANPWQSQDAVLAALDMRAELARYNAQLGARRLPELQFGIGIHCGELLAGVIGNEELRKFSVVGDPINVASRVERLTRVHRVDLLVTEEVRAALDDRFLLRAMPPAQVRGKAEPIVTYLVEGLRAAPAATPA